MHRVRWRDINRIDVRVGKQLFVAAMTTGHVKFIAELVGGGEGSAADGDQGAGFGLGQPAREDTRNATGAENSPAKFALRSHGLYCNRYCSQWKTSIDLHTSDEAAIDKR